MRRFGWAVYCIVQSLSGPARGERALPQLWFERRSRAVREFVFLVEADLIHRMRKVQVRFAVPKEECSEFPGRLRA